MADELAAEDVRNLLDLEPNGGLPHRSAMGDPWDPRFTSW